MTISKERLLVEFDELLRTLPAREALRKDSVETFTWLGRLVAAVESWDIGKTVLLAHAQQNLASPYVSNSTTGYRDLTVLLHSARSRLILETSGPITTPLEAGSTYPYFDEIRRITEQATEGLLYVDPYLDAEFVSRYLPYAKQGVKVRLLTSKKRLATLLPAVDSFIGQSQANVAVRTSPTLHDRYLFVDGRECFQSGASFKDGALKAPTLITQIHDAFPAVWSSYTALWDSATQEK